MTKNGLKKTLSQLRSLFSSSEASEAIDTLEKELEKLPEEAEIAGGDFPLPVDIRKGDRSFLVFSDGACRGNPGPGAWGTLGQNSEGEVLFESSGVSVDTTNNRMELEGAYEGLKAIVEIIEDEGGDPSRSKIHLYSDSKYVVDGLDKWVDGWKKRGWKKGDGKVPENVDQWQQLDELKQELPGLSLHWVKGHSGHPQNEYCDQLANQALDDAGF